MTPSHHSAQAPEIMEAGLNPAGPLAPTTVNQEYEAVEVLYPAISPYLTAGEPACERGHNQTTKFAMTSELQFYDLSPPAFDIQKLPVDLFVLVLLHGRGDNVNFPWNMAQVTRGIRAVVMATPLLWSIIDIMYGPKRVTLHLERSQSALLDVRASYPPLTSRIEVVAARIKHFVELVNPHCDRIHRLEMVFIYMAWLEAALPLITNPSTKPQFLDVGLHDPNEDPITDEQVNKTLVCCQPRNLCLRGVPVWQLGDRFWSEVKTLEYREKYLSPSHRRPSVTFDQLCEWLAKVPLLEALVLEDFRFAIAPKDLRGACGEYGTMRALREVRLVRAHTESIRALWTRIYAPNIQSLSVDFLHVGVRIKAGDDLSPRAQWLIKVVECCPQLEKLDVTNLLAHGSIWMDILQHASSLTNLRLAACGVDDTIRLALEFGVRHTYDRCHGKEPGPVQTISYLCPKLEHLVFDNNDDLPLECVKDIVDSRLVAACSRDIRTVVVHGVGPWDILEESIRGLQSSLDDFVLEAIYPTGEYVPVWVKEQAYPTGEGESDDDSLTSGDWELLEERNTPPVNLSSDNSEDGEDEDEEEDGTEE
ncbi:hypothetical protein FRB96_008748 [Tulasnella sp. 330]|nr:hypothetical protein FRB96_008748 [Tulasnella sp. 330]